MTDYALLSPEDEIVRTVTLEDDEPTPTIAENKGRWVPVSAASFDPATQVRGSLTLAADKASAYRPVRAFTNDELSALRAQKVAAVNAEAERRILDVMPEYQQRNSLALGMEFVTTLGPDPAAWPADQRATYQAVMAQWAQIKAIRAKSDALGAAVPQDAAGIAGFDPLAGWE